MYGQNVSGKCAQTRKVVIFHHCQHVFSPLNTHMVLLGTNSTLEYSGVTCSSKGVYHMVARQWLSDPHSFLALFITKIHLNYHLDAFEYCLAWLPSKLPNQTSRLGGFGNTNRTSPTIDNFWWKTIRLLIKDHVICTSNLRGSSLWPHPPMSYLPLQN